MITNENDSLLIRYTELQSELVRCADRYVDAWCRKIAVQEMAPALEQLLATNWSWLSAKQKKDARSTIRSITTTEQLAVHFKACVDNILRTHQPELEICFQRTLRLPDDGKTYPLPPGLGRFPLRPLSAVRSGKTPADWPRRGGVIMPMYQAEALWLNFETSYPFALKVGTGLVNAITGKPWTDGLSMSPQDHLVLPEQPWLDGYCVSAGTIRQFVAARLGKGYTAEEQIEGTTAGGLQLEAVPVKPELFFEQELKNELPRTAKGLVEAILRATIDLRGEICFSLAESADGMGLGVGGKMKQEIYEDPWPIASWDLSRASRCWVHLCDAARWLHFTGEMPPQKPITAKDYAECGLPWFDFYRDDLNAIEGSSALAGLKSVFEVAANKSDNSVPQESSVLPGPVIPLGPHAPANAIIEWDGN